MKKLTLIAAMFCSATFAMAQTTATSQNDNLAQRVASLENQIASINQRLDQIQNDNVHYRQALQFGKAVSEAKMSDGTLYKLLSVTGDKSKQTVTFKIQVSSAQRIFPVGRDVEKCSDISS